MKTRALLVLLALSFPSLLSASTSARFRGFVEVPGMRKVSDARELQAKLRAMGFDLPGVNTAKREIEVIGERSALEKLKATRLPFREEPWALRNDGRLAGPDERFLNPERLEKALRSVAARHPARAKLLSIGKSIQGRDLWALVVSETPDFGDPRFHEKPTLYIDGLHHAREVMTPEIVLDAATALLDGVARGVRGAKRAMSRWNFVLLPMVNPDGSALVWSRDPLWRKNAHASQGARVHGVDINRNYAFNWKACNGSSGSTGAQDYRGDAAASEPETQAIIAFAEKFRPTIALSYHSYSELILYPYGCKGSRTGDFELHAGLAKELSKLLPSDTKKGGFYEPGTPWELLYSVDGDSMSHLHARFGALSYTFEVNQAFQPSYDLRAPTVEKNRKAWQALLEMAEARMLVLQVLDKKTGRPAPGAKVELARVPHRFGEAPFLTNAAGAFFKVLLPGEHELRVTLPDGRKHVQSFRLEQGKPVSLKVEID